MKKKTKNILLLYWTIIPFSFLYSQEPTVFNTGNIYVGGSSVYAAPTLYVGGDFVSEGSNVTFDLEGNMELTGDFVNDVTSGNVFGKDNTGTLFFLGNGVQMISGSANKSVNYIDFPNVSINNPFSVQVEPDMGMEVNRLDLQKGRLLLKSQMISPRYTDLAHLFVKQGGSVTYNRDAENKEGKGVVQVELALGDNYLEKRIVGFSSPFKKIYADYFIYNYLTKPSPSGLFGDSGSLIIDAMTPMNAGEGYLLAQGLIDDEEYYKEHVVPEWSGAKYEDRATDYFNFARDFMPASFSQYNTSPDRFSGEELNISDVLVPLTRKGFNYVGNPFTTPIDLSTFVLETEVADEWGVTRGLNGVGELRNSFYVVSEGTGYYEESTRKYYFTISYLLGQQVGGTLSTEELPSLQIAPMQLFVIGKNDNSSSNFTIPASARSHGPVSFLKSAVVPLYENEIMIETIDEDTRGYDRLCIVFRKDATLKSNDPYDASKLFNLSGGVNQIYTLSSDDKKMTTNVIPYETKSMELFLMPSEKSRTVSLSAYRLSSLDAVDAVLLEDRFSNKWVDLKENPSYEFTTNPEDEPGRFVLHFTKQPSSIDNIPGTTPFIAYSANNHIYIKGLTETDLQGDVIITDLQGRIMYKDKVFAYPGLMINEYFGPGIYIVKLSRVRDHAIKVIVK